MSHDVHAVFHLIDGDGHDVDALRERIESSILDAMGGSTADLTVTVETDDWQGQVIEVTALVHESIRWIDAAMHDLRIGDDVRLDLLCID